MDCVRTLEKTESAWNTLRSLKQQKILRRLQDGSTQRLRVLTILLKDVKALVREDLG